MFIKALEEARLKWKRADDAVNSLEWNVCRRYSQASRADFSGDVLELLVQPSSGAELPRILVVYKIEDSRFKFLGARFG